jgi:hypothetical protein
VKILSAIARITPCLALISTLASPASGQQLATSGGRGLLAASISPVVTRADSAKEATITLPSVVASGAPRSFQVVSIPVPATFATAADPQVEIIAHGEFVVLGQKTRALVSREGRKTRITITIGIPAGALAGHLLAAEARFSAPGTPTVVVPVEIDVSLVRRLTLRAPAAPANGQAGSDVILRFEIENAGNARETLEAELTLPSGWSSRDLRHRTIVIEPGATAKRTARVAIPKLSSTGSSFVKIDLWDQGGSLASSTMAVEVLNASSIGRQSGPNVVSALSHANNENGGRNGVYSLTAAGPLFDSVRIDARMSHSTSPGAAASNAFARMGTFISSPSVVLSSPSGQLSLGNTGTSFSELTGLYPYGQGALFHLRKPDWDLVTLGAMSMQAEGTGKRQPMLGVRVERQLGELRLSTSLSHLADGGSSPRRLDAIGVGAAIPALFGSTIKAEIAERRFEAGRGFGWSTEMLRTSGGSSEQFRISHAPGGSDAFARATDEIVANVSERLGSRMMVSASGWRTTDETTVFSGLTSSGFSLRPQYDIYPGVSLALEARTYLFDASSRAGATTAGSSFGSRESQVGFSLTSHVREFYVNTSAFIGNVERSAAQTGQTVIRDRAPRNYWITAAGWASAGGLIEVQSRIEQTRDRGGFVNQQNIYGIRGEQVMVGWLGGIRAEGDLQRVHGFGTERAATMRGGISVPLINGFALKLDAERNSIFRTTSGRTPWIFGTRIEHAFTLPMVRTPGSTGYVYQDMNGNHRRDRGEAGVAGATVRRGSELSIADENGKYRVGGDGALPVVVDEASLPEGWTGNGPSRGDLAVSLSRSAQVEFVVAQRSGISVVDVDLQKALVIARDAAGREWWAIMTGPSTATFDALPVGVYTLDFDLSQLTEPLVPRGEIPALVVDGKESRSLTITLDPRPIRMWTPTQRPTTTPGAK